MRTFGILRDVAPAREQIVRGVYIRSGELHIGRVAVETIRCE